VIDLEVLGPLAGSGNCGGPCRAGGACPAGAIGLWRGQPLADVAGRPFALAEIRRLEAAYRAAPVARVDADAQCSLDGSVIAHKPSFSHQTEHSPAGPVRTFPEGDDPAHVKEPYHAMSPTRTRTNVAYYVQTHSRPAQVERLVEVITEGSPGAVVLVGHDVSGQPLNVPRLQAMGNVHVLPQRGGYGDFTHVDRYVEAADWLDANGVGYDWLENLSGQCYPLRPIAQIEDTLAALDTDGFLLYSPVFPERVPASADQGAAAWYSLVRPFDARMRYDYRHWQFSKPSAANERLIRPLMAVNLLQPWVQVSNSYSTVGIRRRRTVFGPGLHCYGGSFFCTLSADCVRYVSSYAKANPDVVAYFRTVLAPEEVFFHSVLVN